MKLLLSLLLIPVCLFGQLTYVKSELPYNSTTLALRDTFTITIKTAHTVKWFKVPRATDVAIWYRVQNLGSTLDSIGRTITLRNSITNSQATLVSDTVVMAYQNVIKTIPASSLTGYDLIGLTNTLLYSANSTRDTLKVFFQPIARSGGNFTSTGGVAPTFNYPKQFYYKSGYTASTANDTIKNFIPIVGGTDLRVFARSTDSLVATVYYQLRNTVVDTTKAWVTAGTFTHEQPLNYADTSSIGTLIPLSTLLGYDAVKFYIDYAAGSTAQASRVIELFYYLVRREPLIK